MVTYTDKFIAFVDILGFKSMVEASTQHMEVLSELLAITAKLGDGSERANYEKYGPLTCPEAPRVERNLNFQVTQISDCAVISSEISPAGLINLVTHCWQVSIRLLQSGVLCRGFISRGLIYHDNGQVVGPGYQATLSSEHTVTAFQRRVDEVGTPFIEIDDDVVAYVAEQPDVCVKMMFDRLTKFDGSKVALFPFKRLNHDFIVGGIAGSFEPESHLKSVSNIRCWIAAMKKKINANVRNNDPRASEKAGHYLSALDAQLKELDKTESVIRAIANSGL